MSIFLILVTIIKGLFNLNKTNLKEIDALVTLQKNLEMVNNF